MATLTFQADDTGPVCGVNVYCSGGTLGNAGTGVPKIIECESGATGTVTTTTVTCEKSTSTFVYLNFECPVPAGTTWASGTWTVKINITTANSTISIKAIYICRVSSGCASQATIGSATGLNISLGSTGVISQNVSGVAQSPSAGDEVIVVFEMASSTTHTAEAFAFDHSTGNTQIISPLKHVVAFTATESADLSSLEDIQTKVTHYKRLEREAPLFFDQIMTVLTKARHKFMATISTLPIFSAVAIRKISYSRSVQDSPLISDRTTTALAKFVHHFSTVQIAAISVLDSLRATRAYSRLRAVTVFATAKASAAKKYVRTLTAAPVITDMATTAFAKVVAHFHAVATATAVLFDKVTTVRAYSRGLLARVFLPVPAPLPLDGHNTFSAGSPVNSVQIVIKTKQSPDVIILIASLVNISPSTATISVSDTAGLNWVVRVNNLFNTWEFYAIANDPLSNDVVTITLSGGATADWMVEIFGVAGVPSIAPAPFDPNPSFPVASQSAPGFSTGVTTSISTSNPNDFILSVIALDDTATVTPNSPFTKIDSVSAVGFQTEDADYVARAVQTNLSVGYSWAFTSVASATLIVDAIQIEAVANGPFSWVVTRILSYTRRNTAVAAVFSRIVAVIPPKVVSKVPFIAELSTRFDEHTARGHTPRI